MVSEKTLKDALNGNSVWAIEDWKDKLNAIIYNSKFRINREMLEISDDFSTEQVFHLSIPIKKISSISYPEECKVNIYLR